MKKSRSNGQDIQTPLAIQAAELAIVGAAITTLGDTISTISAILALEAERQEQNDQQTNKNTQKQINYLTSELEKLKKQVNNPNAYRK